ncbi:Hsp70 family protein [Pseudomonas mediterranea]|uniref:molecular chaperone HscC n=1 Tax=Pseudomonas mediterranea TaxID=183795 RepID=UPI0006D8CDDB|nr:molecular chaperone HscC [Pseudomonas mediterranea]MBL0845741.1 molecular chaperone HscC [Pseudomonas mediterranea]MDU9030783.1 molecular chaperone HscC [Pseudomonas mediterranea]QHA82445.1 Hsp70 family protein [Pseudomonas mediterranea]UZE03260.1 molecular chaperone HscC [Pseudomonas mediterranea]
MIVGIDLGTTHSLIAAWRDGAAQLVPNALGEWLTPSVVGLDDEGRMMVGRAALERLQTHPQVTTSLFKRYMGSARLTTLGNRQFRAEELSAMVLRSLREDAERHFGEPVEEAVISVPAYFNDAQRKATRIAGELAGFKVERLINEPTAAALAYGLHQRDNASTFLVFDLGGGTFDVSILELFEGVMEVRASAGDNYLGGEDFDTLLLQAFVAAQAGSAAGPVPLDDAQLFGRLRREAERVRKVLGHEPSATFSARQGEREWRHEYTQAAMAELYAPLLTRLRAPIETALRDARIRASELDEVLLVGGTTRMPLVRKLTASLFGRFPSIQLNPDEAVALGAAVQAGLKSRDAALEEVVLTDVCPYSMGIEISVEYGNKLETGHYLPIIERNCVVPVSKVKRVVTLRDQQKVVLLKVYQGESRQVSENILLGELEIAVPPMPAGEVSIDVRFTYDTNGLLEADALTVQTGERRNLVIANNAGVLGEEEIAQRLKALESLKVHPRDEQPNTLLIARLERLYQESRGELRHRVDDLATRFAQMLDTQELHDIRALRMQISEQLEALEQDVWR